MAVLEAVNIGTGEPYDYWAVRKFLTKPLDRLGAPPCMHRDQQISVFVLDRLGNLDAMAEIGLMTRPAHRRRAVA